MSGWHGRAKRSHVSGVRNTSAFRVGVPPESRRTLRKTALLSCFISFAMIFAFGLGARLPAEYWRTDRLWQPVRLCQSMPTRAWAWHPHVPQASCLLVGLTDACRLEACGTRMRATRYRAGLPCPRDAIRVCRMQSVAPLPSSFVIRGGRVIDPANRIDHVGDVVVVDGRFATCETLPATVIDARGLIVCPGLIDMHVHLREPGGEHKETIETGTRAAAAGGFTAVACMPNTSPSIDSAETLAFVQRRAEENGYCRVYPVAAITRGRRGVEPVDIGELRARGAVAFSDDGDSVAHEDVMREACRRAHRCGALLVQHCENKQLSAGGVVHEGAVSRRLGLPGLPAQAEAAVIERDLGLVRETRVRYHIAHLSTAGAVELVRSAKRDGVPVTCEVCVHHLVLTDEACCEQDPNTKVSPPLRGSEDVAACIEALADGTVDCIVTDHAPHAVHEKAKGMLEAPFGVIGLETALAVLAERLVRPGVVDWSALVALMSVRPATILGVQGGTLTAGAPADVTLIDPDAPWRIDPRQFRSKSRNTPFAGWEVHARAAATIAAGRLTHRLAAYRSRFGGT